LAEPAVGDAVAIGVNLEPAVGQQVLLLRGDNCDYEKARHDRQRDRLDYTRIAKCYIFHGYSIPLY